MTFGEAQTKFASFVASAINPGDVPAIPDVIRNRFINEAYLQIHAMFFEGYFYTNTYARTGNYFIVGLVAEREWLALEGAEIQIAGQFQRLRRSSLAQILYLAGSEGATGTPTEYGMGLASRLVTKQTQVRIAVYPVPTAPNQIYRFRIKSCPNELSGVNDVLMLDAAVAEYVPRLAGLRAGMIMGYSDEWAAEVALPLPGELKAELDLNNTLLYPFTPDPRTIGGDMRDGV